jgi:hypothetical protein
MNSISELSKQNKTKLFLGVNIVGSQKTLIAGVKFPPQS